MVLINILSYALLGLSAMLVEYQIFLMHIAMEQFKFFGSLITVVGIVSFLIAIIPYEDRYLSISQKVILPLGRFINKRIINPAISSAYLYYQNRNKKDPYL